MRSGAARRAVVASRVATGFARPVLVSGSMPLNLSIDTDSQQQAAASPLVLVVRSFLR